MHNACDSSWVLVSMLIVVVVTAVCCVYQHLFSGKLYW